MKDLTYAEGSQELEWQAPEGQASSVTSVAVYPVGSGDDGATEAATTGSASVDSVDTTVDVASGAAQSNPRLVYLTATAGIVLGRSYLLTNFFGEKEWVEPLKIDSANLVELRAPLLNDYDPADGAATFRGVRLSIGVDDAWAADSNKISDDLGPNKGYRIRWEYVVGGETHVHADYFDLARYGGSATITPADMVKHYSRWVQSLPDGDREDQGQRLIDRAYDDVSLELHAAGKADEMVRNRDVFAELVKRAAVYLLQYEHILQGGERGDAFELAENRYHSALEKLVTVTTKINFAADSGGGGTKQSGSPLFRR